LFNLTEVAKIQAGTSLQESELRALLGGINADTFENIVFNDPGSSGAINSFLQGGGLGDIIDLIEKGGEASIDALSDLGSSAQQAVSDLANSLGISEEEALQIALLIAQASA